jgi:hypothetical protein
MSTVGTIDCGYLAMIQATADQIWADPIANADYKAAAESAKAILANQRVNFSQITQGNKKKTISVEWENTCAISAETCGNNCAPSGEEITPQCVTYDINTCVEAIFQMSEKDYRERVLTKEEAIAKGILAAKKSCDEKLAAAVVAALVANAGVNEYTGGIGTVNGTITNILASFWTAEAFGYFNLAGQINRFNQPYFLTGVNLWQVIWNALNNAANADGKGATNMVGFMPVYQDPINIEANAPLSSFLLHKNALALLTKTWWPLNAGNAMQKAGQYFLWSEPSMNLPGITYDIQLYQGCDTNDFVDVYTVSANYGIFLNPTGCSANRTGILQFECGSGTPIVS